MSYDPKGVLFYGYCWPTNDDGDDVEFETELGPAVKQVLIDRGLPPSPPEYPVDRSDQDAWQVWRQTEWQPWRDTYDQAAAEIGVDWGHQGSWEFLSPYLYALESRKTAEWGDAQPVTDLAVGPDWRAKLDAFLASQDIEPPEGENQPGWWLTSFYG